MVHGLDHAALAALAAELGSETFAGSAVVARGQPPVIGEPGRVDFAFGEHLQPGHRRDGDGVDFHERGFLHPAAAGAEIARVHPPIQGVPGTTVLGRPLAVAPVRPAALRLGPGVAIDSNGLVHAARDGVVTLAGGGIDVVPLFIHKGNVDLRTGNLHTHGSVQVTGDLGEGFQVEADGDVEVQGCTYGGSIVAGGTVKIGLGIQAGSRIEAGGEIRCRHATSSKLSANSTVIALDELVNCEAAAGEIHLLQGRGHVLGGSLRARTRIAVLQAGSDAGVPTLLAAGDLTSESAELQRRDQQRDRAERNAKKALPRAFGPARGGKLGRSQMAAVDAALTEKLALAARQREFLATATIEIRGAARAGVRIRFGTAERKLETTTTGVRFRWDASTGQITEEPT